MGTSFSFCCNNGKNSENINYQLLITHNIINTNNNQGQLISENNHFTQVRQSYRTGITDVNNNVKQENLSLNITEKEPLSTRIINLIQKQDFESLSENLKQENMFLNIANFKVNECIYNFENKINKFSSEILLEHCSKLKSFYEDKFILKLLAEHTNKNQEFKNIENTREKEKIFTIINKHQLNQTWDSSKEKNIESFVDLRSSNLSVNKVEKKFNLFPVYVDLQLLDKIYFGEWSLCEEKLKKFLINNERKINILNLLDIFDYDGLGTLIKKNSIQEGIFKGDMLNGPGRIVSSSGDILMGCFSNGLLNNQGIFINKEGNKYKGEFKNSKMSGYGLEFFKDGSIFEGFYKNNQKNGKGKFKWQDGSEYEGEIKNNEISGFGKFCWNNGIIYIGEWVKGKMQGKGLFKFPSGEYYEGEFEDNKKHGKGQYFWNENKYYDGYWFRNLQHGEGLFVNHDKRLTGFWKEGKMIKKNT